MEDRADDVEAGVDVRPLIEDEGTNVLTGLDLDRIVLVLVGDAVPDDEVGSRCGRVGARQVAGLALRAEVPLVLDQEDLAVDRRQSLGWLDDDHAVHAVEHMAQRAGRPAVVHVHARVLGLELVELLLTGIDVGHLVVPGNE